LRRLSANSLLVSLEDVNPMTKPLTSLLALVVLCCAGSAAKAESAVAGRTRLSPLLNAAPAGQFDVVRDVTPSFALRGGAMFSPRGAAIAGADVTLPILKFFDGWTGRIDADVIIKANFAGANTVVPVTLNQVYYLPGSFGGRATYLGGGAGAVFGGGGTKFTAKGLVGAELTQSLGGELNVYFAEGDTLWTAVVRLHR
jgi:hypothetical protein